MIWLLRTSEGSKHAQGWGEGKHVSHRCSGPERPNRSYRWCSGYYAPHDATSDDVAESDASAHSEADAKAHPTCAY